MFKNMKIGMKVTGSCLLIFVFVTVMMVSGAKVRMSAVHGLDSLYGKYVSDSRKIGELKTDLDKIEKDVYRYIAVPSLRNNTLTSIQQEINSVDQFIQAYQGKEPTGEEKRLFTILEKAWPEMQRGYKEIMKAADGGKNDDVSRLLAEGSYVIDARKKTMAAAGDLHEYTVRRNEAAVKDAVNASGGWSGKLWLLSFFGAVILLGTAVMLTESITKPLKKGVLMMEELKRGHLSKRLHIKRNDEIGLLADAMNEFADHLQKNVVYNMQQISEGNIHIEPAIIDAGDEIGPALKKIVDTLKNLVQEMNMLTNSTVEGMLEVRGNAETFNGAYQEIVSGVNKTLDALTAPLGEAFAVVEKMANKDLSSRLKGDYKGFYSRIKGDLNAAVENLDKAMQQVAIGADQVASASLQVSTGGQSLSQGSSEQASSLEEVSSSLQEMSSMTKQNTLNAREAKGVAEAARSSADRGVESMNRMSAAINQIKSSSDSTARIVKTIDEIAFQTNLLALNAAVEAARAGDAGKGFAVVAEEVRNLAMRSAEAAKNTAGLIEDAVKNSERGVAINTEVLKNFEDIAGKINKVSQVVAEIAAASEQQDQGISQVNKAVEQLNQVTQHNAANAEESASAAQEMSSQSEEMRSMVASFKLTGTGVLPQAMRSKGHAARLPHIPGMQPDPGKVIPLDEKDHDILTNF
jgi:methyl-accepting chemotaxis protein